MNVVHAHMLSIVHPSHDDLTIVPHSGYTDSPFGDMPSTLGDVVWNTVVDAATFLYDGLVATVSFIVEITEHLVEMGLKLIDQLTDLISDAVHDAVQTMVDTFNAFVDWLVEAISDMLEALVAEPLQAIQDSMASWVSGLVFLLDVAAMDIAGGADNASASRPIFEYIIGSDLFNMLMAIGISFVVLVTAMRFMGPAGLLSSFVPGLLVDILFIGMAAAIYTVLDSPDIIRWIADSIIDILGDDLVGGMTNIMGATIGTIGWIASMMYLPHFPLLDGILGFVSSSVGAFISWYGSTLDDWEISLRLDLLGLAFASWGCFEAFLKKDSPIQKLGDTALGILKGVAVIEAGISTLELTTTVASYE